MLTKYRDQRPIHPMARRPQLKMVRTTIDKDRNKKTITLQTSRKSSKYKDNLKAPRDKQKKIKDNRYQSCKVAKNI